MTVWRLLTDDGVDAAEGLAGDEALMADHARTATPASPVLRLYTYASHSALCGRYQHLEAEIDIEACSRTGTSFNRRPTGGGAIIMGAGQLGVAVVGGAPVGDTPKAVLRRYSEGVVTGLAKLGVEAAFGGKNDLKVDGRKIAGLGLYLDGEGGLLFHASVLADLDVAFMLDMLAVPAAALGDGAVAAVESRVTTVSRETGQGWDGVSLRDVMATGFAEALDVDLEPDVLTASESRATTDLVESKYSTPEWLFQQTPHPDSGGTAVLRTPAGQMRLYLALQGDVIKSALVTGDLNEIPEPVVRFEAALKWSRADRQAVERVCAQTCSEGTGMEGVEPADLVGAVLEAADKAAVRDLAAPDRKGSCYFPESDQPSELVKEQA
jgi:lipoate-protein ligase A